MSIFTIFLLIREWAKGIECEPMSARYNVNTDYYRHEQQQRNPFSRNETVKKSYR